jgi:hypothetical protein
VRALEGRVTDFQGEFESMKVHCPICAEIGVVEQRGNSVRVIHYEWVDGKRVLVKHKVELGTVGNRRMGTVGTVLGTEKAENGILLGSVAPPIGLGPMTDWLTASRSTWLSYGGSCSVVRFQFCGRI